MAGHCFERVARAFTEDGHVTTDAVIVHGLPVGTGPDNRGERYWHAWIEPGDGTVIAPVGDEWRVLPASMFYALGRLDAHGEGQLVWRFDADAVWSEMQARGQYGPWVDNYEALGK